MLEHFLINQVNVWDYVYIIIMWRSASLLTPAHKGWVYSHSLAVQAGQHS